MAFSLFDAVIFQSKPSVGRATCAAVFRRRRFAFQSKPSVGRATAAHKARHRAFFYFNPRPPWGGRLDAFHGIAPTGTFQSTPSVGRATNTAGMLTPCLIFQSTPSVGRATSPRRIPFPQQLHFNPRPPWGGRLMHCPFLFPQEHFNPRPPWGGRRRRQSYIHARISFQSTPSVGRATLYKQSPLK